MDFETLGSAQEQIEQDLQAEINDAVLLRERAEELFVQFGNPDQAKETVDQSKALLAELITFEENVKNFPILNFLYAVMARTALNSLDARTAIKYANAGIAANEKQADHEGVNVNKKVLLDTACLAQAFDCALTMIDETPEIEDPGVSDMLKEIRQPDSKNDKAFKTLIEKKTVPTSLKYCLDEQLAIEERAVRTVMQQMGISRNEAMKYKKLAEEMIDK